MANILITKKFIMDSRTAQGSWTKKQIEALGLSWPTAKGWIKTLTGSYITQEQARAFENGNTSFASRVKQRDLKQQIVGLNKRVVELQAMLDKKGN